MSSYFRSWFGGSSSTASSSKSRSRSSGPAPIYAPTSGSSASANVQRSYSFSASRATHPSPLRYATGPDTRTMHGYAKRSSTSPYAEPRANSLRRASYKTREPGKLCKLLFDAVYSLWDQQSSILRMHPQRVGTARRPTHGRIQVPRFSVWGCHGPPVRTLATITLAALPAKSVRPCGRTRAGNRLALPPHVRVHRAT